MISNGLKVFACPFHKWHPTKYPACGKYVLKRVKDVKQHLFRVHKNPDFYCARCSAEFTNSKDRDWHVRDAQCAVGEDPRFDGITFEQRMKLMHYAGRNKPPEDQWYIIWEIIFSKNTPRPPSPFLGNFHAEAILMLRDLWSRKQYDILASVPHSKRLSVDNDSVAVIMEQLFDHLAKESKTLDS